MGWERRTKREHECNLPSEWQTERKCAKVGDIWRCRKCGTRWKLTYKGIYSTNRAGPMHENSWSKLGSPEDIWRDDPPRQTGTDWLYTV